MTAMLASGESRRRAHRQSRSIGHGETRCPIRLLCSSAAPSTTLNRSARRCSTPFVASSSATTRWSSSAPERSGRSTSALRRFERVACSSLSSGSNTAACLPASESRIRRRNTRKASGSRSLASSTCAMTTFPSCPSSVERDPDKLKLLEAWRQTLNAKHTVAKFEDWPRLAVQVAADIGNFLLVMATAAAKGVAEAPLREVLKRLGETEVAEAEIPDRLAKAADELIQLRTDLNKPRNDAPEFTAIRARASALIDKGDLDAADAAFNEGRLAARERVLRPGDGGPLPRRSCPPRSGASQLRRGLRQILRGRAPRSG